MEIHIVCFSGGKDSTAMLFKLLEAGHPIDYIVFCDTGAEFPEMYEHIDQVRERLRDFGKDVIVLKSERDMFYYLTKHKRRTTGLPYYFPSLHNRWCTSMLKREPLRKFKSKLRKELQGKYDKLTFIDYVGFTLEEQRRASRLKKKENPTQQYRFPLVEWGFSGAEALRYCYSLGFDWGGLYKFIDRVSCWCCPFMNNKELEYLIKHRPELWAKIKAIERHLRELGVEQWKFRPDKSCEEIEKAILNGNRREKSQPTLFDWKQTPPQGRDDNHQG